MSVSVRVVLCAPTEAGANFIPIVQFVLGAIVIGMGPHVPVPLGAYSGSDELTLEMISGWAVPVL